MMERLDANTVGDWWRGFVEDLRASRSEAGERVGTGV
jgi:hypothetical protein